MTLSVIIENKLSTAGIAENRYEFLLEGIYQPNIKSADSWKVVDVRKLFDNDSNIIEDYKKYIDLAIDAINLHGRVVICCSYGISRSNAIAVGVLVKYFNMDLFESIKLVNQKVEKADINKAHIEKLINLFSNYKKKSINRFL